MRKAHFRAQLLKTVISIFVSLKWLDIRSLTNMVAAFDFMQDNVALIVVLEARDTGTIVDSQAASGKRGQLLCVVRVFSF